MDKLETTNKEVYCDFDSASYEEILEEVDNLFDNLILE